ncbi:MAG TPA: M28 family peptidase [Streptosporangiaceae bacterium]|jgi:hypothetical protein
MPSPLPRPDEASLRATVERLAFPGRGPTSQGEEEAARWIADRLSALGWPARVEEEEATGSYAWPVAALCALAAAGAVVAGRGPRMAGVLAGLAATAGIIDDVSCGPQVTRRMISPRRTTHNVVAETGDPDAARALVVTVHHDAAPSGLVFDQTAQRWFADRFPGVIERITQNPPLWWPVVAGPALVAAGSATGSRGLRRTGLAASAIAAAALADIGSRPAVPGANDNLSGVAALIEVAGALRDRPVGGLRVLLVSAGAEEALQQGIRGFARRHFRYLATERTWFLNLDTVGSGNLVLLEGEGPLWMEDYSVTLNGLIQRCADEQGIPLKRGLRSRNSTDGVVPNRAGYPTATLVSVDDQKLLPGYHLPSDTPDAVDYTCVANAALLTESVARTLAALPTT